MARGKFIVFEGINGCGKGVQIDSFAAYLRSLGKAVPIFTTGEPSQFSEYGAKARELLAADGDPYQNQLAAVTNFSLDRGVHNGVFVPLLERGITVLSDRYWHSTFAFQMAQGVSAEEIARRNRGLRVPDLTVILDVPSDVAQERIVRRLGGERRKFERDLSFVDKVRQNYLQLHDILPGLIGDRSIVVVDGNRSVDEVAKNVQDLYKKFLLDTPKT